MIIFLGRLYGENDIPTASFFSSTFLQYVMFIFIIGSRYMHFTQFVSFYCLSTPTQLPPFLSTSPFPIFIIIAVFLNSWLWHMITFLLGSWYIYMTHLKFFMSPFASLTLGFLFSHLWKTYELILKNGVAVSLAYQLDWIKKLLKWWLDHVGTEFINNLLIFLL